MENIFIPDKKYRESWTNQPEVSEGGQRILDTYFQMQLERFNHSDPSLSYFADLSEQTEYLYNQILHPEKTGHRIPKSGISSEILTYIAFKENGIPIKYSSYQEDTSEHFDFFMTSKNIHVDTTSSNSKKDFVKKYVKGKVLVLHIPFGYKDDMEGFMKSYYYSVQQSYMYRFLKYNEFDSKAFLYHILDMNSDIINRLNNNSFKEKKYKVNKVFLGLHKFLIQQLEAEIKPK